MELRLPGLIPFYQRHMRVLRPIKSAAFLVPGVQRAVMKIATDTRGRKRRRGAPVIPEFQNLERAMEALDNLNEFRAIQLFEEAALLCRTEVRYDELKRIIERFRDWADDREFKKERFLVDFLEVYDFAYKNLNGRVVERSPRLRIGMIRSGRRYNSTFLSYFTLLTSNLEYDRAEEEIRKLRTTEPHFIFKLASLLERKPARVELDVRARRTLATKLWRKFRLAMARHQQPEQFTDLLVQSAHGAMANQNPDELLDRISSVAEQIKPSWQVSALLTTLFPAVIRAHGPATCREALSRVSRKMEPKHVDDANLRISYAEGDMAAVLSHTKTGNASRAYSFMSELAWQKNDFPAAREYAGRMVTDDYTIGRTLQHLDTLDRLDFLSDTDKWISSVPQPARPEGIVLLGSLNCYNTLAMVGPALIELKKRGYVVGSLMNGVLRADPPDAVHPDMKKLFNLVAKHREDGEIRLDWEIDWPARKVCSEGINFYQGIYERLSTTYRRATISIDTEPVATAFESLLRRCDYVLRACLEVDQAVRSSSEPIVFLGSNSHIAPYSVIRDFCLSRRNPKIRYVAANVAYENYYTNLGAKLSGSMAVVDMTLHQDCRAAFLAIRSRFDRWYEFFGESKEVEARFSSLLAANRSKVRDQPSTVRNRIVAARNSGRRVICCFGKILCDLCVPYDGGPAHRDMIDWINHSVDVARRSPDMLLLIKPHPHELRPEIALELTEKLRDVLPAELPENVIFLDHNDFNIAGLAPHLDTAVLWNGTSGLELTGLGVPVIMCAHFGRHDYPIDLIYPKDRQHYETLLSSHHDAPADDLRWRAMALLHYMGTKEVAIPNEYSRRPITNDRIGIPTWNADKMTAFLASGDPHMSLVADRILEGLER